MVTCGDTHVEIDTRGQSGYDATGIGRFHRQGAPFELGLSMGLAEYLSHIVCSAQIESVALSRQFTSPRAVEWTLEWAFDAGRSLPVTSIHQRDVLTEGHLQRFAREVPRIESTHHIERLKLVVKEQMYAALAQIGFLAAPAVLFGFGLVNGVLGPGDVLYIILPSAVILVLGLSYKSVETRVKSTPAADDELARQRNAIVETWTKKALPDW